MKKSIVIAITFLSVFIGLYAISHTSYAQDTGRQYTLLAPLPLEGGQGGLTRTVTFTTYVNGAFRFVLGVAGILAVIMIIYAGFTYMTTDAFQKKEEGKEIISNAVKGLLLAIGTWIILNTINPNLLNFTLNIEKPSVPTAPTQAAGTGSPSNGAAGPNNQFCVTCKDLSGLNLKPGIGTTLDAEMADKLKSFNSDLGGINWRVTEAFPPTSRSHASQCHYNGTCIDANFTNGTPATAENINTFINTAASNNMIAEYEVATEAEATRLRNEGVTGTIRVVPYITAPHFSVYNAQAPITN